MAGAIGSAAAASPALLAPERAFAFSARGIDPATVEARFAIADGYYLYRDKLRFSVEPGGAVAAPTLPEGKWKEDPYFGRVQTYRGEIVVRLALERPAGGAQVTIKAESQGCADVGVCYPPQIQRVSLALPVSGAAPGPPVDANPKRPAWFQ